MEFLWFLIIGGLAGFIAGKSMKGEGFGIITNIVVGIVGGLIGGFLFGLLGLDATGLIGRLVVATVGAVVLLFVADKIKNK